MKLYSGPLSMFGAKVQIAAIEKQLAFDLEMVPFNMQDGYSPKHPEVLRINPKRQVPVLVDGDLEIFDSTQIFEYFEDLRPSPALWPSTPRERALARKLEHLSDEIFFPHIIRLMGLPRDPHNEKVAAEIEAGAQFYERMESLFNGNDFLAGDFSYADIAFYMAQLFGERWAVPMTAATPKLLAWRVRMSARQSVRDVVRPMLLFLDTTGRPAPESFQILLAR